MMKNAKYGRKPMLKKVKRSYYFKYNRICVRAFKAVRQEEGEREIFKQLAVIQKTRLYFPKKFLAPSLGCILTEEFSDAVSQKLFKESIDTCLASLIMLGRNKYKDSLVIPYPKPWKEYLKSLGLVPKIFSPLLFWIILFYRLKEGVREVLRLYQYKVNYYSKIKNYISFVGVPENGLLETSCSKYLYNFLSYTQCRFPEFQIVCENPRIAEKNGRCFQSTYTFLPLIDTKKKILFLISSLRVCLLSILSLFLGHWTYAYMLKDIIISNYVARLSPLKLPKKVIFLNSSYIYKPLWAIEMEKKGAEVALMFYATNTYDLKFEDRNSYGIIPGYERMTWNTYYTLHSNHKNFIEESVKRKVCVHVETKPFSLTDSIAPLELPEGPKIALFDVQPFRDAFLASIGRPTNIYTSKISEQIFSDILKWCEENKVYLIIKPKRDVHKRLCMDYASLMKRYDESKWCIFVDSMYSPMKICKQVQAVVCQPFTSAALFALSQDKPVTYYDPISRFVLEQPANQGIPLRTTCEDLYKFLNKSVLN